MTLSLRTARTAFEVVPAVIRKVAADGDFLLTAGQLAKQPLPDQEAYQALAAALGDETPLFRFVPRTDGSSIPRSFSLSVFADGIAEDATPRVYGLDFTPIEATFLRSKVGPGGYSVVRFGGRTGPEVEIEITMPSDLVDGIRTLDDGVIAEFEEVKGAPPTTATLPTGEVLPALRPVPQRDIPPHSEDVPQGVDLKVTAILPNTRGYDEPRIAVELPDGSSIVGLIATSPIRQAIGVRNGKGFVLTEAAIGESFQILEVVEMKNRQGEPVLAESGKPQRSVIVRRTTGGGVDLDLSL